MAKKILIAEDSSVILNLTKKILMQQNFEIVTVKNGNAVLEKLDESFDLILMDINMPLLDGMETTRRIREMKNSPVSSIPIFAITGNAGNYSIDEFKAVGINEYLQKPLDFDRLVTLVNQYTS